MLQASLFRRVDNSILIAFRILFGLLLSAEGVADILSGRVWYTFIEPRFTFTFIGFEWLQPLPGNGMIWYFAVLAILGAMVALGLCYRLAMGLYTIMWACVYFMHKEQYNNHYYLILLLCCIMAVLPAHRYASIDVWRRPAIKKEYCERWIYLLFIAQMGIVYFFGGVNKIYPDWLSGKFIAIAFRPKYGTPIIGPLYSMHWFQLLICYGGLLFDLLITPLLLYRRTRMPAFLVSCLFHIFNAITFSIGIFPFLALATTLFFFEPDKIRTLFFPKKEAFTETTPERPRGYVTAILAIYMLVQVALPLRAFFYPGNPNWTEEGHRLSWRMMLRNKKGSVYFTVRDNSNGSTWTVWPADKLTSRQVKKIGVYPDMIWQFAQLLKREYAAKGHTNVSIFAHGAVSLNGRPAQPLIKPDADLAAIKWSWYRHSDWVTELQP